MVSLWRSLVGDHGAATTLAGAPMPAAYGAHPFYESYNAHRFNHLKDNFHDIESRVHPKKMDTHLLFF